MTPEDHAHEAAALLDAEATGIQIGHLTTRHPAMGMDDAYAVQNAIHRAKIGQGRRVIGWKIGLTSKAMQDALGIDIPDSGILFDDMAFDTGAVIPAGRFIQPRIEAEIAFVMRWIGAIVSRDGEVEETGLGAGVLNDPVESVVWLARRMAQYGQRIEPGHVILSGSFIRPVECPPGTVIHADFGGFGTVDLSFQ